MLPRPSQSHASSNPHSMQRPGVTVLHPVDTVLAIASSPCVLIPPSLVIDALTLHAIVNALDTDAAAWNGAVGIAAPAAFQSLLAHRLTSRVLIPPRHYTIDTTLSCLSQVESCGPRRLCVPI